MRRFVSAASFAAVVAAMGCSSNPPVTDDGGSDAPVVDVKPDKSNPQPDAQTCGSKLQCEVCDGSFSTTQMVAPFANAAACSTNDIAAFVTACGSGQTGSSCDDWQTTESGSAPDCLSCVFSDQAGKNWGVYVCDSNGNCSFNTPGCLDVALGTVSQEKQAGGAGWGGWPGRGETLPRGENGRRKVCLKSSSSVILT